MEEQTVGHVRLPRKGEIFGVVTNAFGGGLFGVMCVDGKERKCRVPGKIRRRVWVRIGDVVLIKPWVVEGDKKADIVWRYTRIQADWLKHKGYLKMEE